MSNLVPSKTVDRCTSAAPPAPALEAYAARSTELGRGLIIRRALPVRQRRLVGPWCFFDHYGPLAFTADKPMDVASHPHIGLQTVSWLIEGEVLHSDSLDNQCIIRPGELNLMTAGYGVAHSDWNYKWRSRLNIFYPSELRQQNLQLSSSVPDFFMISPVDVMCNKTRFYRSKESDPASFVETSGY